MTLTFTELYFGFVKPQVEPGVKTAEPSRGGTQVSTSVLDFEEVQKRDNPRRRDSAVGLDSVTFVQHIEMVLRVAGDDPADGAAGDGVVVGQAGVGDGRLVQ